MVRRKKNLANWLPIHRFTFDRRGDVRLELLLGLALVWLLFQFVPSLWTGVLWTIDVRNWPRTMWFAANGVVVITLVAIRFGPDLYSDWRKRRERVAAGLATKHKQQHFKEQREAIARIKECQQRRVR